MTGVQNILLFLLVLSAAGCSRYDLLVNDNLVWQPQPLFSQYQVADQALRDCLAATIEQRGIHQASELKQLNCRYAGIESLAGLEQFSRLEALSLIGNPLQNIESLFQLVHLQQLELQQTSGFVCTNSARLRALPLSDLRLPETCN